MAGGLGVRGGAWLVSSGWAGRGEGGGRGRALLARLVRGGQPRLGRDRGGAARRRSAPTDASCSGRFGALVRRWQAPRELREPLLRPPCVRPTPSGSTPGGPVPPCPGPLTPLR